MNRRAGTRYVLGSRRRSANGTVQIGVRMTSAPSAGTPSPELAGVRDRPGLATVVRVELMRLRHGFLFWYSLLAPIVAAVPLYIGAANSSEAQSGRYWEVFRDVSLELWGC